LGTRNLDFATANEMFLRTQKKQSDIVYYVALRLKNSTAPQE
jgi:hypothetical protein